MRSSHRSQEARRRRRSTNSAAGFSKTPRENDTTRRLAALRGRRVRRPVLARRRQWGDDLGRPQYSSRRPLRRLAGRRRPHDGRHVLLHRRRPHVVGLAAGGGASRGARCGRRGGKLEKAAQAKADKARHDPGDPCRYMSRPIKEEEAVVQEEKTRLAQAVEEARNIASSSPPSGVPKDAVETVQDALPTSGPHAIVAEIGEGYAYDDLGAAITQRSVQTQLQYSAALRNEPQVSWLSKFLGHDHLGPKLRDTGVQDRRRPTRRLCANCEATGSSTSRRWATRPMMWWRSSWPNPRSASAKDRRRTRS